MRLHVTEETLQHYTIESLRRCRFAPCEATWLLTTGRSGTEWLTHVLNDLEPFRAVHEPWPTLFMAAREIEDRQMPPQAATHVVKAARFLMVEQSYRRGLRFVDTSPRMTSLAPAIRDTFSSATFIHLSREPRAFVRSANARQWYKLHHPQEWWFPHKYPEQMTEPWQRLVWYWDQTHRHALELERVWGPDVVHRVKAEDLWANIESLNALLSFLGQSDLFIHASQPALEQQMRTPRNVGHAHADWTDEMETFLQDYAGKTMRELGYE